MNEGRVTVGANAVGAHVVAVGTESGFLVVWYDAHDPTEAMPLRAVRVDLSATPVGAPAEIGVLVQRGFRDRSDPFDVVAAGGGYLVAWHLHARPYSLLYVRGLDGDAPPRGRPREMGAMRRPGTLKLAATPIGAVLVYTAGPEDGSSNRHNVFALGLACVLTHLRPRPPAARLARDGAPH